MTLPAFLIALVVAAFIVESATDVVGRLGDRARARVRRTRRDPALALRVPPAPLALPPGPPVEPEPPAFMRTGPSTWGVPT